MTSPMDTPSITPRNAIRLLRVDKRIVAFEPSDGKPKGRWYANVGTATRADGKKYNVFLTFLRRDLDRAARAFGRSSVLIESAPAYRVRLKFEEQPAP